MEENARIRWEGYAKDRNLLQLPVFCFSHNTRQSRTEHEWYDEENGHKCKLICVGGHGVPGALEQDVYAACLRIWVRQGMPASISITFTDIAETLSLDTRKWGTKIKRSLCKIGMARYEFHSCWKDRGNWMIKTMQQFSLFESTAFNEISAKRGRKIDRIILYFPQDLSRNIEAEYYMWLDLDMYKRIKSGLPRRLYEYLQKKRYVNKKIGRQDYFFIRESLLCQWLPIITDNKTYRGKKVRALACELKRAGFLKRYSKMKTSWHFWLEPFDLPEYVLPLAPVPKEPPRKEWEVERYQKRLTEIAKAAQEKPPAIYPHQQSAVVSADIWREIKVGDTYNGETITHKAEDVFLCGGAAPVPKAYFDKALWKAREEA